MAGAVRPARLLLRLPERSHEPLPAQRRAGIQGELGGGGLGSPPPAGGPAAAPGARGCSRCAERRPRTFTAVVGAVVTRWQYRGQWGDSRRGAPSSRSLPRLPGPSPPPPGGSPCAPGSRGLEDKASSPLLSAALAALGTARLRSACLPVSLRWPGRRLLPSPTLCFQLRREASALALGRRPGAKHRIYVSNLPHWRRQKPSQ